MSSFRFFSLLLRLNLPELGLTFTLSNVSLAANKPDSLEIASSVRKEVRPYEDKGLRADKDKKALFGAAREVINLTANIGTEIVGLQLSELTDQQKDEVSASRSSPRSKDATADLSADFFSFLSSLEARSVDRGEDGRFLQGSEALSTEAEGTG